MNTEEKEILMRDESRNRGRLLRTSLYWFAVAGATLVAWIWLTGCAIQSPRYAAHVATGLERERILRTAREMDAAASSIVFQPVYPVK